MAVHLDIVFGRPVRRSIGAVTKAALRAILWLSAPADRTEHEFSVAARDASIAITAMTTVIPGGLRRCGAA